jgi:hypothetical protein
LEKIAAQREKIRAEKESRDKQLYEEKLRKKKESKQEFAQECELVSRLQNEMEHERRMMIDKRA